MVIVVVVVVVGVPIVVFVALKQTPDVDLKKVFLPFRLTGWLAGGLKFTSPGLAGLNFRRTGRFRCSLNCTRMTGGFAGPKQADWFK